MVQSKIVNLNINFRNTESTESIKNYANEKISNSLKKFIHHDVEAHLVLMVEKNRHIADISFHVDGADFTCKEESDNLYASIDNLVAALSNQLRRHKEKLTNHHAR